MNSISKLTHWAGCHMIRNKEPGIAKSTGKGIRLVKPSNATSVELKGSDYTKLRITQYNTNRIRYHRGYQSRRISLKDNRLLEVQNWTWQEHIEWQP